MWKTGTSAASWELRRQGRYEEAWRMVEQGCEQKDAEVLVEMCLCYPDAVNPQNEDHYVECAATQGHPVAMAMLVLGGWSGYTRQQVFLTQHKLATLLLMQQHDQHDDHTVLAALKESPANTYYWIGYHHIRYMLLTNGIILLLHSLLRIDCQCMKMAKICVGEESIICRLLRASDVQQLLLI